MNDWKLHETQPQFERIRSLPKQRVPKNIFILFLLALAYWLATQFGSVIVLLPAMVVNTVKGQPIDLDSPDKMWIMLYLTVVSIIINILICKLIERRTLRTMGVTKHLCLPDYLIGAVLGLAMFSAVIGINYAAGAVRVSDATDAARSIPMMIVMFTGWMIQGFSEEFAFRGFMMMSAGTYKKPWIAVIFSAIMFGAAHIGNSGATVNGVLNVALFGVVMSLYMLRTDSIWGPAALHTVWNWAQGSFFGLKVSGLDVGQSVLHFEQTDSAAWMNGGSFGLEGGLGTTIILIVVGVILLFLVPQRKITTFPAAADSAAA